MHPLLQANGLKEFYQNKTFAIPVVLVSNFLLADVIKKVISIWF